MSSLSGLAVHNNRCQRQSTRAAGVVTGSLGMRRWHHLIVKTFLREAFSFYAD
jgi:hypothetical protein